MVVLVNPRLNGGKVKFPRRLQLTTGYAEFDQADLERIGDQGVPRRIEVTFPSTADKWPSAQFVIEVRKGVPVCTSITVQAHDEGREVRSVDLRAVRLEDWVENIVAEASVTLVDHEDSVSYTVAAGSKSETEFTGAREVVRYARKGARRSVTDDLLRQAADIYRQNVDANPVESVATAFQTSHRTAARYVSKARELGLLPPTTPGKKNA